MQSKHVEKYIYKKKEFRGSLAVVQRNNTEGKALFAVATRNVNYLGRTPRWLQDFPEKQAAGGLGALPRPSGLVLGTEDVKFSLSLFLSL